MSLTLDHGDIVFQCDGKGCHETLETRTSNFDAARNLMKRAGWKPFRFSGDDWKHHCITCGGGLFAHGKTRREQAGSSA